LTQDEAETGLFEYIEKAQKLQVEYDRFEERLRTAHRIKHQNGLLNVDNIVAIIDEKRKWSLDTFGHELFADIPDTNVENYQIGPVEIGKVR
jgi:hypothetical protein